MYFKGSSEGFDERVIRSDPGSLDNKHRDYIRFCFANNGHKNLAFLLVEVDTEEVSNKFEIQASVYSLDKKTTKRGWENLRYFRRKSFDSENKAAEYLANQEEQITKEYLPDQQVWLEQRLFSSAPEEKNNNCAHIRRTYQNQLTVAQTWFLEMKHDARVITIGECVRLPCENEITEKNILFSHIELNSKKDAPKKVDHLMKLMMDRYFIE